MSVFSSDEKSQGEEDRAIPGASHRLESPDSEKTPPIITIWPWSTTVHDNELWGWPVFGTVGHHFIH